jgi:superfamily II DNA or RNA helicase
MNLRPYQRQTIDSVRAAWRKGDGDVLAMLATGAGKTIIFLALIDEILHEQPDARILVVAHRKELIEQPAERIAQFWPGRAQLIGIVMADQNECDRQIVIGTVQTLQVDRRMAELLSHGPVDYLIIDEAHHAAADGYLSVIQALRDVNPNLKHLGVTATPERADNNGLPYESKVVHFGVKELVRDGYLAPPRWLAIQTGISLAGVSMHGSGADRDFSQRGLVDVFETDNCFDLVVESHGKYADGRKALAFTSSVEGSYRLAEKFNAAGIAAVAADGTTKKAQRSEILSDFRAGRYAILCNCALYGEGLDVPEVSCIHQVRPTKSDGLYLQMVGRGLRTFPGKEDCIAEGQRVLTDVGLVPIECVTRSMKVWDGVSFVTHSGAVCRGYQEVISYAGLTATPDHKVWTDDGWKRFGECAENHVAIAVTGKGRTALREISGYRRFAGTKGQWQKEATISAYALHNVRSGRTLECWQSSTGHGGMSQVWTSGNAGPGIIASSSMAVSAGASSTTTMHESSRPKLFSLRGKGNRIPIRLAAGDGGMGCRKHWDTKRDGIGSYRQQRGLHSGELSLGYIYGPSTKQKEQIATNRHIKNTQNDWVIDVNNSVSMAPRPVYDLSNAGPRKRFMVRGDAGPFLVHNCTENFTQAIARCVIAEQMLRIAKRYKVVLTVHDAVACIAPEGEREEAMRYVEESMAWRPSWASGLPLACEAGWGASYGDC